MPTHEEDWEEWRWIELDANAAIEWEKQEDGTEELIIPVCLSAVYVGCTVY